MLIQTLVAALDACAEAEGASAKAVALEGAPRSREWNRQDRAVPPSHLAIRVWCSFGP